MPSDYHRALQSGVADAFKRGFLKETCCVPQPSEVTKQCRVSHLVVAPAADNAFETVPWVGTAWGSSANPLDESFEIGGRT